MKYLRGIAAVAIVAAVGAVMVHRAPAPTASADASTSRPTVYPVSAADLGATWRPECPVAPTELRRIDLDYLGFDGSTHRGQLVVNEDVVAEVIAIFGDLKRLRYPIETMRTVDHYPGADDELSMRDNNTSAFNCRALGDGWSLHAYGRAIDINPLVNPYNDSTGDLQPTTAARYLDRGRDDLGLLHEGDAAVQAFTNRGWRWGGDWSNPIDYQHFERP